MTALEVSKFALARDEEELLRTFSRKTVKFEKATDVAGLLARYRVTVNLGNKRTYIIKKDSTTPIPVNKIMFFIDVPTTYPKTAVKIYYGEDSGLYHINAWNNQTHTQCIDVWNAQSSIMLAVEKTLHAILYDEAVCRYDSMANGAAKDWQQAKAQSGEFPIASTAILYREECVAPKPVVSQAKNTTSRTVPRPATKGVR